MSVHSLIPCLTLRLPAIILLPRSYKIVLSRLPILKSSVTLSKREERY
jgi:hypothetical protein